MSGPYERISPLRQNVSALFGKLKCTTQEEYIARNIECFKNNFSQLRKKIIGFGEKCSALLANLGSMCPKEQPEKKHISQKTSIFFKFSRTLGKNFLSFLRKLRAGLSKLHSLFTKDLFEELKFFGKPHIF